MKTGNFVLGPLLITQLNLLNLLFFSSLSQPDFDSAINVCVCYGAQGGLQLFTIAES